MTRSMDAETFPTGPCQYYCNAYFMGGETYKGPYTDPGSTFKGVTVNGNKITIKMAKPFPDMPYWGSFPAMGPIPQGKVSDPKTYKNHPLVDRSLHDQAVQPVQGADPGASNPNWDPNTDPARTQYPDGYDFKLQQPSEKIDQILLADSGDGQTTMTYDDLLAPDFTRCRSRRRTVWSWVARRAPTTGRRTTARSPTKKVRRGAAVRLPLQERDPRLPV